ncbi:Integral membrane protein (intg_mem_TP0381) [Halalkalibacter krulwichiae]|uniref:Integral membrane protein (Intg_mem_TP0381) n=3 Tax=Halalkalibacter krulwichiae TaxID=199441 RepID=A0A1X9MII9_9BACI|nr:Integral membrane protein (intg_mem_TP0381) [Halalkalibacter krulwichiae]
MDSIFDMTTHVDKNFFLSPVHIYTISSFVLVTTLFYHLRNHYFVRKYSHLLFIVLLVISEISIVAWSIAVGQWDIRYNLPLQLCTISLYLCIFMLATKNFLLFEFVYFFGLGGAIQAILTPDLFYTFPHFRFIHFFVAHIAIIFSILYMVWVMQFRVTFRSLIKSFALLNVLAILAFIVNIYTGTNYMFLARKPTNPSILDYLGPYPWYIISLEFLVFFIFLFLYLPFILNQKRKVF